MRISDLKTYVVENPPPHHGGPYWVFLKLTTDSGIEGFGEVYGVPFGPHRVTQLIEDVAESYVEGQDPFKIETMWRRVYSSGYSQHPDLTLVAVLSGLEIACWDIIGKALDQPIYNLLGGQVNERLRSYTYLYPAPPDESDDDDAIAIGNIFGDSVRAPKRAVQYMEMGFTGVKFDPVMPMGAFDPRQLSLEALSNAALVTKNIREAVGDKVDLLIGTHGQMTTSSAIRLAKRLEPYDPLWFEEPVPPENRSEMSRVARHTSIPVATGERLTTKYEFADLLGQQAAAILQPALARVGGILEAKKIAGMAEAYYAQMSAASVLRPPWKPPPTSRYPRAAPTSSYRRASRGSTASTRRYSRSRSSGRTATSYRPPNPGLGIELDEDVAARHAYGGGVFPQMLDEPLSQ